MIRETLAHVGNLREARGGKAAKNRLLRIDGSDVPVLSSDLEKKSGSWHNLRAFLKIAC